VTEPHREGEVKAISFFTKETQLLIKKKTTVTQSFHFQPVTVSVYTIQSNVIRTILI